MFGIFGCQISSNFQFIAPQYNGKREIGRTLLIIPLLNDFVEKPSTSSNKEEQSSILSEQDLLYFYNYISPALSEQSVSEVWGVDTQFKPKNLRLKPKTLKTDDEKGLEMFVPDSSVIDYKGKVPDYVLLFQDLFFKKALYEECNGLGKSSDKKYTMEAGLKYMIWDNKKCQIVAFGKLFQRVNLFTYPSKQAYIFIIDQFAATILKHSPLAYKINGSSVF